MAQPLPAFESLFRPFKLGARELRNRFALAPMTRARAGPSLIPNKIMETYYEQRASAALVITEGVHISPMARGWADVPGIWSKEQVEAWKPIVRAIHKRGSVAYMQLWHQGRQSHSSFHDGKVPVSASAVALKADVNTQDLTKAPAEVPHALTVEEIHETVQDFARAAKNAIEAGFDGVEIHGANGYLVDQFMQSVTNHREDAYGGSIENRFRFAGEVLDAVVQAVGAKRTAIRFSPNGLYGEMGSKDFREQFSYAIREVGKRDIAFLHAVDGLAFGFHQLGEPMTLAEVRKLLPPTVALVGNCGYTAETAAAAIQKGDADIIAFGRPFLSNPDLPERIAHGWPLAAPLDHTLMFTVTPENRAALAKGVGYTDQPTHQEVAKN